MTNDWMHGLATADVTCTWNLGDTHATCLVPIDGSLLENEEVIRTLEEALRNQPK